MSTETKVTITAELTDREAWHLAQMIKRASRDDFARLSDPTDREEPVHMESACRKIWQALGKEGYNPR